MALPPAVDVTPDPTIRFDVEPFAAGQVRIVEPFGGDVRDGTGCDESEAVTPVLDDAHHRVHRHLLLLFLGWHVRHRHVRGLDRVLDLGAHRRVDELDHRVGEGGHLHDRRRDDLRVEVCDPVVVDRHLLHRRVDRDALHHAGLDEPHHLDSGRGDVEHAFTDDPVPVPFDTVDAPDRRPTVVLFEVGFTAQGQGRFTPGERVEEPAIGRDLTFDDEHRTPCLRRHLFVHILERFGHGHACLPASTRGSSGTVPALAPVLSARHIQPRWSAGLQ